MLRDGPKLFCLLYKRNGKIMRQENGKGEGERGGKKELFLPPVINQYSSHMLPACAIIINYTQERSWNRKRTVERGEREEERRNKGILFSLGD